MLYLRTHTVSTDIHDIYPINMNMCASLLFSKLELKQNARHSPDAISVMEYFHSNFTERGS